MNSPRSTRNRMARYCRLAVLWIAWAGGINVFAQQNPNPAEAPEANFPRETLTVKGGRVYRGYLLARHEHELEFLAVGLPKGRPMFLVRISFDPHSVESYEPLAEQERQALYQRIRPLLESRRHAVIEAGRMDDVHLKPADSAGTALWLSESPFFRLVSSADEASTRRCYVRIEQVFRAFQRVLPPRIEPASPLVIRLHGSVADYRQQLDRGGLNIRNPAYYSVSQNTIVAGSDLTLFAERLQRTREQNEQVRQQYQRLDRDLSARLAALASDLKDAGFQRDEIQREVAARRAAWRNELDAAMKKIDDAHRRNEARFAQVTERMFARLYHEAFHAYLQNYVFPEPQFELPRWLNEGLAQVFETAQIDEDRLRIDSPDADRLERLQQELRDGSSMPLERLLAAPAVAFLSTHDDVSSERHYLYAWGLAYYLTFYGNLLEGERLATYVADQSDGSSRQRFERLVGMPLSEFEPQWRKTIERIGSGR